MTLVDEWRSQRFQRQQAVNQRKQSVQVYLGGLYAERQKQTQQLREQLRTFRATLQSNGDRGKSQRQANSEKRQQQIQSFLEMSVADRSLMAEQLALSLNQFVNELQVETQEFLLTNHQHRQQVRQELKEALTTFRNNLQQQVALELQELALIRQYRGHQVQQLLQQSQAKRLAEAQALKERLAELIASLRQYRTQLTAEVWGTPQLTPTPVVPKKETQPKVVKPEAKLELKPKPTLPVPVPASQPVADTESEVYHALQANPGVRLAELETLVGTNRVQTVNALRSLIQKGMIVQRDRFYFPQ